MSMSVQQTMEDVVLKPAVVTRWVVSHVSVTMDSPVMDSLVLVCLIKYIFNHYIFCLIYISYIGHVFACVPSRLL